MVDENNFLSGFRIASSAGFMISFGYHLWKANQDKEYVHFRVGRNSDPFETFWFLWKTGLSGSLIAGGIYLAAPACLRSFWTNPSPLKILFD